MDRQFCQPFTPHPLGADRDRFLYLINDIKNRKDDYATQLSHIALASMSATRPTGDGSKQEIISSLLGRGGNIPEQPADNELEALWQARLVLEIGAILDQEEMDLAETLVSLEGRESELFAKLQGKDEDEEENLFEELQNIKSKVGLPRTESIHNRFRAWFRLIRNAEMPPCFIWTTSRQEVADILLENFEKSTGNSLPLRTELIIPAHINRNPFDIVKKVDDFRFQAEAHLPSFYSTLLSTPDTQKVAPVFSTFLSNWHDLLDRSFPASEFGRATIRFYHFGEGLTHYTGKPADSREDGPQLLAVIT